MSGSILFKMLASGPLGNRRPQKFRVLKFYTSLFGPFFRRTERPQYSKTLLLDLGNKFGNNYEEEMRSDNYANDQTSL